MDQLKKIVRTHPQTRVRFKLGFIELLLEMQNEECRMQNECIFSENGFNKSAEPTPLFYILHSAFCIAQPKLRGKLQFEIFSKDGLTSVSVVHTQLRRCFYEQQ